MRQHKHKQIIGCQYKGLSFQIGCNKESLMDSKIGSESLMDSKIGSI